MLLSAPGAKDVPSKADGLVGEWVREMRIIAGVTRTDDGPLPVFRFDQDGKGDIRRPADKSGLSFTYKLDPSVTPVGIECDFQPNVPGMSAMQGIVKVEGETLTLCLSTSKKPGRPAAFESPKDSETILYVMKRVKPKD